MSISDKDFHDELLKSFDSELYTTPSEQKETNGYFPDYLKNRLHDWLSYYENNQRSIIDAPENWGNGKSDIVFNRLKKLIDGINASVDNYYAGKVLEATEIFNSAIVETIFQYDRIPPMVPMSKDCEFYRARGKTALKHFKRPDLFHVPFEKRHLITTKRYSIPGLPALYFGNSAYICWEELDRTDITKLWFSRFQNQKALNVLELLRYQDFRNNYIDKNTSADFATKNGWLFRYIVNFPLNIACTIKVKEKDGVFKPEYIIPQLLLQYVSNNHNVDGIKYPSTKVDYNKLTEVPAYNYVFPVKSPIKKKGFCDILIDTFYLTQPTSIELEMLSYNPMHPIGMYLGGGGYAPKENIELIDGEKSPYYSTSFGRIEQHLKTSTKKIERLVHDVS